MLQGRARAASPEETAEWRSYLKSLWVAPSLRYLARLIALPRDAAVAIAACLDPEYSSLDEHLAERFSRKLKSSEADDDSHTLRAWPAAISVDNREPLTAVGKSVGSAHRKRQRRPYVW
jgi:hypothetical protein